MNGIKMLRYGIKMSRSRIALLRCPIIPKKRIPFILRNLTVIHHSRLTC